MSAVTTGIQAVSLMGLAGIVMVAAVLWRRYPDTRGLLVPPALWGAYGVVYYILILSDRLTDDELLLFGAIHRMLAVYMIFGGLVALWTILRYPPAWEDDGDGVE